MDQERQSFYCSCGHLEHQFHIWYDGETNGVYVEPLLSTGGFWYRVIQGIKYILGYKSKYGLFSEIWLSQTDCKRFINELKKVKRRKE